jgi:two-component system, OmpR family, phosphate regulon sensor histidine kinase PhoR
MRARSSRKLRLAPLWPALAAVVVMTAAVAWQLPPLLRATAGNQLLDTLRLVHRALALAVEGDPATLQRRTSQLAAGTTLRVTVIGADGRVLADSDRTAAEVARMESHAERQEVAAALGGGAGTAVRRSDTTQRRYVYAARAFPTASGGRYVLRLAQPLDELALVRGRLLQAVGASLLVTLLVIAVLSIWLDRRLLRPLAALIGGTSALAAGRTRGHLDVPEQEDLAELATAVNRLTDRVEAQVAGLGAERDHLQGILASMSEGVLVVDGEGRAVLANPAFRRLFALLPGQVAGRRPLELARRPELADVVAEALAGGEARREDVEIEIAGDAAGAAGRRVLSLAGAALAGPSPAGSVQAGWAPSGEGAVRPAGAVVVARDTTAVARLARMRSDFVANVSHELKTPLSAIRGYAETLRDGALDEAETARRFVDRVLDQCRRLQALLDDLLTLSRLESPDAPREQRPVDLVRVVERSVETVAPRARERRVEIAVEAAPALPLLEGDANGLERLVLNLLDNAVKYNRPEGRVTVALAPGADEAPEVVLTVADTGIGIPAAALDRIFERFYRVDKGRARDEGGTGLGLAIVKHVAQAHGGRVEVESRPGHGSTFRVRLPASPRPLA